jgi:hypothetical protein
MYSKFGKLVVMFLLTIFGGISSKSNIVANEKDFGQIKNEIVQQWRVYLKNIPSYESVCHKRILGQVKEDIRFESVYRFKYGIYPNFSFEQKQEGLLKNITSTNKRYSFRLHKENDEDWVVAELDNNDVFDYNDISNLIDNTKGADFVVKNSSLLGSLAPSLILFRTWLPDVFLSQDFQIEAINNIIDDGDEILEVVYKYEPSTEHGYRNIRSGTLYLFKNHYYLIKKANFDYFDTSFTPRDRANLVNEFSFENHLFPILRKQTIKAPKGIDGAWILTLEINEIIFNTFPQSEFTLSHYALPEPDFGERRTNRIRYIIIGIGILMMAIGAYRIIQRRRERI